MSSSSAFSEHGALPLGPIERPSSWFVRSLYLLTRKRYGLVPTAFRVVYARAPFVGVLSLMIAFAKSALLRLDAQLAFMIPIAVAMRNGCTFCADLTLAEAARARIGRERLRDLLAFESSPAYTEREKSALRYVEAVHASLHVPDSIWGALDQHFTERERLEIVWLCAVERYFNALALPLRIGTDHLSDGR